MEAVGAACYWPRVNYRLLTKGGSDTLASTQRWLHGARRKRSIQGPLLLPCWSFRCVRVRAPPQASSPLQPNAHFTKTQRKSCLRAGSLPRRRGFSHCCLQVRLESGFTALSIQRTSAGASCYRVTKQTRRCSARPVATDEKLPQERGPIRYFDCDLSPSRRSSRTR